MKPSKFSIEVLRKTLLPFIACATFIAAPLGAYAQSDSYFAREVDDGVRERSKPEYSPLGISLGAFEVLPSLRVTPEYDSNIYASSSDAQSDFITTIAPSIVATTDWSRNELDAHAGVVSRLYASHGSEGTTDFDIGSGGRLDLSQGSDLTASLGYEHLTEPRTSEATVFSARTPVEYNLLTSNAGALQTLNRFQFNETVSYSRYSFNNNETFGGQPLPLDYRDDQQVTLSGRAAYAYDPNISFFIQGSHNERPYVHVDPSISLDRSSSGYEVTVGTNLQLTHLMKGELQVGYLQQDYKSSEFHTVAGPAAHGQIEYYVSPVITLTADVDRNIIDTADPVSVSALQTRGGIEADYEFRRNIILSARVAYEDDDYSGVDREDGRSTLSFSGSYLLNRGMSLSATYSYLNVDSIGADRGLNYEVNVLSLSLVLQR